MTMKQSWWRRMRGSKDEASCHEVARLLQSYLDGNVDEVTARRVARHLEVCRRCGLEAETYTRIKESLARRGGVDPEAVERLRAFGARLAESGPEDSPGEPAAGSS